MNLRAIRPLTWLMAASIAILGIGIAAMGVGLAMQDALWQVIGLLAIVAGGVKIAVVLIWTRVVGLDEDDYTPTPAP
ncbi:MAG: hypothetical protein ACTHMX_06970 [Thermomicrobiales bacterium]